MNIIIIIIIIIIITTTTITIITTSHEYSLRSTDTGRSERDRIFGQMADTENFPNSDGEQR